MEIFKRRGEKCAAPFLLYAGTAAARSWRRRSAEELIWQRASILIGVEKLSADQRVGGQSRPIQQIRGALNDDACGSMASDSECECSTGQALCVVEAQLWNADVESPGQRLAQAV